jgi:hypothetical protein
MPSPMKCWLGNLNEEPGRGPFMGVNIVLKKFQGCSSQRCRTVVDIPAIY